MSQQRKSRRTTRDSPPGRLRIVAGKWKSRNLKIASAPGLRPTSERIRETLFNWLSPRIHGARCLDLFAGTGALGLEALSRGAATVTFVERSREAVTSLRQACDELGADGVTIHSVDALRFLDSKQDEAFDLVFLDPPFADDSLAVLCRLLNDGGHLSKGARIYLEQDKRQTPPELPEGWVVAREKTAGNVRYSLLDTPSQEMGTLE
jgi:16S rRNA (guanine966-N2)-methyltransferase